MGKSVRNWKSFNLMALVTIIASLMILSPMPAFAMGSRPSTEPWKFTWRSSTSGNWSNSDRWNQEKSSESEDDYPRYKNDIAILTQGTGPSADTTVTIDIDNVGTLDAKLSSVSIYSNSNFAYSMILSSSNRNLYTENLYIGLKYDLTAHGKGIYNQSRGTTNVNNLYLGTINGANGTYNLSGTRADRLGALKVNSSMNIGGGETTGIGTFNLNNFGVLDASSATVNLNNGGTFGFTDANSSGKATISTFNYNGGTLTLSSSNAGSSITNFNYNKAGTGSAIALPNNLNRYAITNFTQTTGDLAPTTITLTTSPATSNTNNTGTYNKYTLQGGSLTTTNTIALNSGGYFKQNGGTLNSNLTQSGGTVTSDSILEILNNKTFTYNSGTFSGRLLNKGTVTFNNDFIAGNGMEQDESATTAMTIGAGRTITLNGDGLDNEGTTNITGGRINATFITNRLGGTFNYSSGSLYTDAFNNFGVFLGTGTIRPYTVAASDFNLTNSGTMYPGGMNTIGTLAINGNFGQTANPLGILYIDLMGGSLTSDFLDISGDATLAGTLYVNLLDGITPSAQHIYYVLQADGGLTGEFGTISNLPKGYIVSYLDLLGSDGKPDTVAITTPLPGTLLMLGTGLLGLLGIRRRFAA